MDEEKQCKMIELLTKEYNSFLLEENATITSAYTKMVEIHPYPITNDSFEVSLLLLTYFYCLIPLLFFNKIDLETNSQPCSQSIIPFGGPDQQSAPLLPSPAHGLVVNDRAPSPGPSPSPGCTPQLQKQMLHVQVPTSPASVTSHVLPRIDLIQELSLTPGSASCPGTIGLDVSGALSSPRSTSGDQRPSLIADTNQGNFIFADFLRIAHYFYASEITSNSSSIKFREKIAQYFF